MVFSFGRGARSPGNGVPWGGRRENLFSKYCEKRFGTIGKNVKPFLLAISFHSPFCLCGHPVLHRLSSRYGLRGLSNNWDKCPWRAVISCARTCRSSADENAGCDIDGWRSGASLVRNSLKPGPHETVNSDRVVFDSILSSAMNRTPSRWSHRHAPVSGGALWMAQSPSRHLNRHRHGARSTPIRPVASGQGMTGWGKYALLAGT